MASLMEAASEAQAWRVAGKRAGVVNEEGDECKGYDTEVDGSCGSGGCDVKPRYAGLGVGRGIWGVWGMFSVQNHRNGCCAWHVSIWWWRQYYVTAVQCEVPLEQIVEWMSRLPSSSQLDQLDLSNCSKVAMFLTGPMDDRSSHGLVHQIYWQPFSNTLLSDHSDGLARLDMIKQFRVADVAKTILQYSVEVWVGRWVDQSGLGHAGRDRVDEEQMCDDPGTRIRLDVE
ncbi:hypothetical protein DFH08DRAFT_814763 [Mycena albidolilacea]|uniref:Uncharacterized protein n=1 Tax=Mycena albidolilacea TaxID=1033008 RepID=A0AAD6ZP06_9AGAR|nr:hypothetical protein DFH08DRAFT_814763 [Mycena albidolilacea]